MAGVLLICLWIRSYFAADAIRYDHPRKNPVPEVYALSSSSGTIAIVRNLDTFRDADVDDDAAATKAAFTVRHNLISTIGIAGYTDGEVSGIVIAYWVLILASVIAAAVPWLIQGMGQFNLRAMLIITTLVALGLVVIVGATRVFTSSHS
jgi:hypothetical protein